MGFLLILVQILRILNSSFDSLSLYVGHPKTADMVAKYCGNAIPPSYNSSKNELHLRFYSDGVITRSGFKLEYSPYSKSNIPISVN